MKKQLAFTLFVILLPIFYVSCVSSILKDSPPTFSKEVSIKAPSSPFASTKASVYPSWKNQKSGNVISIVSDCDQNSTRSLQNLHQMLEDTLTDVKIVKESLIEFQGKPAYEKKITAQLDGHKIELHSISFKRKTCGYVSTLSGKVGGLESDTSAFNKFNSDLGFQ